MVNRKTAIYCRISTEGQELEQQKTACIKYCEMKGWTYEIFVETQSSNKIRPVWDKLLKNALNGQYNVILVFRIDRAWRSSRQFIMDFDTLYYHGVYIVSVMEGLDCTTPIGKAMLTILVALAELERINISIATKQRLQALKNLGKTLGRPKGSKDTKTRKKSGYYARYLNKRGVSNNNALLVKNFDK